jgi:transcriptional regulator with XRE-family HTH domain
MTLSDYLKLNGITEVEFAALIGRSQSAVNRIKLGRRQPDWETLRRIAKATQGAVTPNDFLPKAVSSPPALEDCPGA